MTLICGGLAGAGASELADAVAVGVALAVGVAVAAGAAGGVYCLVGGAV